MNSSLFKTFNITVFILLGFSSLLGQSFDYPFLEEKIQNDNWTSNIGDTTSMNNWIATQELNGSWTTYDYGSVSVSGSNKHLSRLLTMSKVCTNMIHPKYNDELYKSSIQKGLHFWLNSNTTDSNWWWNEIGWPKELGVMLILLSEFPDYLTLGDFGFEENEIISVFEPTSIDDLTSHGVGANMFDIGLQYIYRGIITEDSLLLVSTTEVLEDNLTSNLKTDLSFQEHGPQMHISSYGLEYEKGVVNIAYYLSDSPAAFDIESDNFSAFLKFVREVQIPSIRGQYWDYSVTGRGISRNNATKGSIGQLERLRDNIDSDNSLVYDDAILRLSGYQSSSFNVPIFNTHYWTSDYSQHGRSDFLFTIRNVSDRTVECETGNGENLKAHYLSYGANFIGIDGDEYFNIMPVWDWSMIPGVTSRQTTSFPSRPSWGVNFGDTDFVGGVSANNYGATALVMDYDGTLARKGWFMFDDEIVCLGNSIESDWLDVRTTLNQCLGDGTVFYSEGGAETTTGNSSEIQSPDNVSWIRHDDCAYFFPTDQNVNFTLSDQSGSWLSINGNQSDDIITEEVFKLWIDHGASPEGEGYSYIIVPNISDEIAAQNYPVEEIEIIANETSTQAIFHSGLNMYQIIFYEPGTITNEGFSLSVDIPCVVQVEDDSVISIADPTQFFDVVNIEITSNGSSVNGFMELPMDDFKGSTVTSLIIDIVSIDESTLIKDKNFNIYPNPIFDYFSVDLKQVYQNSSIEIYDLIGQLVYQKSFTNKAILNVDLELNQSGTYYVYVVTESSRFMQKVIVLNKDR